MPVDAPLAALLPLVAEEPGLLAAAGRSDAVVAVPRPAQPVVLAALARHGGRRPLLVAVPTTTDAERIAQDAATFLGRDEVALFPAWETLPFERVSPAVESMGRRLEVMWRLGDPATAPSLIVTPIRALLQRLAPDGEVHEPIVVGVGDRIDQEDLVRRLVGSGYRRGVQVENRGDVAVRGSIVDVFPSTGDGPVRVDLWGDEVDRLTDFAVADQRSTTARSEVTIFPCRELLPTAEVQQRAEELVASDPWGRDQWERLARGEMFDGMESWLPWLTSDERVLLDSVPGDGRVVLLEPSRLRDRASELLAEEADLAKTLARTWGAGANATFPRLHVAFDRLLAQTGVSAWSLTAVPEGPETATVAASGFDTVVGDPEAPARQAEKLLAEGYRLTVAADGAGSAERLGDLLSVHGIGLSQTNQVVAAPLDRGFVLPELKLAVMAEPDVTGRRRAHRPRRVRRRDAQGFFDDLKPGDYVVHHQHGVARYGGMVRRAIGGNERDYLLLEYRGGDRLYVPTDHIDAVRHYTGGDSPSLNRMGGSDWQRAKNKVQAAVSEIAQELVLLYQRRISTEGYAFAQDTPWQGELEAAFPFQETPDQQKAIDETKSDMELAHPMDRLVCGDVGFGKTEVAIRAAFKAIQDGKQVAMLVPTTLLAQQHHQTFAERYASYPVRVEMLSRFLTPAQSRAVVEGACDGSVDLVIGTHRLLSDDIEFKDLGLLIVDEEQRFGVKHKEAIKAMRASVDVLTLTATPIPRTLEMSLTGIRDLTLLHTPPADRQPILTYVGEYDDRPVAEAIRRELLRDGQVFFVHNRVMDIEHVAADLRELVPEARIAVAHGQMDEAQLEQVVIDFWSGDYDVLVCTTIIESGIDMPTVNTLVVDRADLLGLGQLHQLRGRVGRAGMRAYAYLFTPRDREVTEEAYERLKTIGEATELGSGFKIAMRDLEIRGAGNLLGAAQSGHIAAVGYDLYCQLVTEAVAELKGEEPEAHVEITIELPLDANLPADYAPREEMRLEAYRRLAAVTSHAEVDDIRAEWEDRYGPVPTPGQALLDVARLRAECVRTGVREVTVTSGPGFGQPKLVARLSPVRLRASKAVRLERLYPKAVYKDEIGELQLPLDPKAPMVDAIVAALQDLLPGEAAA